MCSVVPFAGSLSLLDDGWVRADGVHVKTGKVSGQRMELIRVNAAQPRHESPESPLYVVPPALEDFELRVRESLALVKMTMHSRLYRPTGASHLIVGNVDRARDKDGDAEHGGGLIDTTP